MYMNEYLHIHIYYERGQMLLSDRFLGIYMYMNKYVSAYMNLFTYIYICMYIFIYIHVYIYKYRYIYL
jgi:hypothetical protein